MTEKASRGKRKRKNKGFFKREKSREETVAYLINLCIGIMEEYDMAIGAAVNEEGIPVPIVIDRKEHKMYQMNTAVMGPARRADKDGK